MSDSIGEMTEAVFPLVVRACRRAVVPRLKEKGVVKVVSAGADFSELVTEMDIGASALFLDGEDGMRARYHGSFSEESDSPQRRNSFFIYENDPCDGTGDAVATKDSGALVGPTNLTALLRRRRLDESFVVDAGMIYDVIGEYALIGAQGQVLLGRADEKGRFVPVEFRCNPMAFAVSRSPVRIGRRKAYRQTYAQEHFPAFIGLHGVGVVQVPVGGAGTQALQLFRSYVVPVDPGQVPAFADLQPIDAILNTQPDWKTWDTDPIWAIARALGLSPPTDLFGKPLTANAANPTLADMHHRHGFVLAYTQAQHNFFTDAARAFREAHPDMDLLEKNY